MIKKHLLPGIIILMTFSLLGIIIVQYFWISNAIEVKEAQFDQSVNKALSEVVLRLKKDQHVMFVSNQVWVDDEGVSEHLFVNDTLIWNNKDDDNNSFVYVNSQRAQISSQSEGKGNGRTIVTVDALRDTNIRFKAILKLDSIRDENDRHQTMVLTELKDSLELIVNNKLTQIKRKSTSINEVIEDMVIELKSIDEPLDEKITSAQIDKRISEALLDKGINLDFEFGVYNPQDDSITDLKSQLFSLTEENLYKTRMFPENVFDRPEMLLIAFPERGAHILRSMGLLLSGSVIFTLIIILTFFLTVRIIIHQKKLSEIKSDFINNMTHEFKTPIATISLAVDSINNSAVIVNPEKIKYFTNVIDEENKRMNSSVENVLQMSLIDKKDFHLQMEKIDIHAMIQQVVHKFELQIEKKKGSVSTSFGATDPYIFADKMHFQNVVSNLLDNAIKYAQDNPVISISTNDTEERISIAVMDEGIGMSKEEQSKIFDKFYRVSRGDIHNVKGFGLGLSYVKAIVLALHGRIEVKSMTGKGSTFKLTFPRTQNAQEK